MACAGLDVLIHSLGLAILSLGEEVNRFVITPP